MGLQVIHTRINKLKKILVFDDDPTGSQSVYGCPLLLNWEEDILLDGITNSSPLIFLLANTRALSANAAELRIREICKSIKHIFKKENLNFQDVLFVSRGDSTLRGHGVMEPHIINQELGPFDATFHVPAFFEGFRTTENGFHLLNGIPVHLSDFASDKTFPYSTSYLPDWLEEKSQGNISSKNVLQVSINNLNLAINSKEGFEKLIAFLKCLSCNQSVVVDAKELVHLQVFGKAIKELMKEKRFLFRSAASLINAFADLPKNPNNSSSLASLRIKDSFSVAKGGLIMVGSHVPLADKQLNILLKDSGCEGLELPVNKISRILEGSLPDILLNDLEDFWLIQLKKILDSGKTPVLYISRGELYFSSVSQRIFFGLQLAELMSRLAARIFPDLGYVISKGGITTHIFLERGLDLGMVELKGQILPGLSIVCPYRKNNFDKIPILTFPGNLGDSLTLFKAWKLMENG